MDHGYIGIAPLFLGTLAPLSLGTLGSWTLKTQVIAEPRYCNSRGGCGFRKAAQNMFYLTNTNTNRCLRHRKASGGTVSWHCYDPSSENGAEEMWEEYNVASGRMRNVQSGMCLSTNVTSDVVQMVNCLAV